MYTFRRAASHPLLYAYRLGARAQKPRLNLYRHCSQLAQNSNLNLISESVPSLIVNELSKANIRCTKEGIEIFKEAYGSLSHSILGCSWAFSRHFQDAWMASDIDFNCFYHLQHSPKSPWRPHDEAFVICMNSRVYKMWEAMYLTSTIFRELIDQEERYIQSLPNKLLRVDESALWGWMSALIKEGVVNREDIENLPNPIDLSKLEIPKTPQRKASEHG
ncbi:hypothetical protein TWF970_001966 [Orbilia oligospora]|uniref:Uncharacterized protein n=1 Tax=Orbilia oligospora TaxID=2813651 RepID=A0A7C8V8R9_ORBOL|nr:hypothetical protein TWF970_001966 [Orbilia oligospora]